MSVLVVNGGDVPVAVATYAPEEEYPADFRRDLTGSATTPVTTVRPWRRAITFRTPWEARSVALSRRATLEGVTLTLSGDLVQGTAQAVPYTVQLLNHPEIHTLAAVRCTVWPNP